MVPPQDVALRAGSFVPGVHRLQALVAAPCRRHALVELTERQREPSAPSQLTRVPQAWRSPSASVAVSQWRARAFQLAQAQPLSWVLARRGERRAVRRPSVQVDEFRWTAARRVRFAQRVAQEPCLRVLEHCVPSVAQAVRQVPDPVRMPGWALLMPAPARPYERPPGAPPLNAPAPARHFRMLCRWPWRWPVRRS